MKPKVITADDFQYRYFIEYMNTFYGYSILRKDELYSINPNEYEEIIAVQRGTWIPDIILQSGIKIYILNTEQLCSVSVQQRVCNELKYVEHRCGYKPIVYDYSLINCDILKSLGYETLYYPYHSTQEETSRLLSLLKQEKMYDIGFVGGINDRRKLILDELLQQGLTVKIIADSFGETRDTELARCKYILNIHWESYFNIFESIRCNRWLHAGSKVISEDSVDVSPHPNLIMLPYENIVAYIKMQILKENVIQSSIEMEHVQTNDTTNHHNELYSRSSKQWNLEKESGCWIGGRFPVSNLSQGYHGILKQWWEFYVTLPTPKVLIVSESQTVKNEFHKIYPHWTIDILDLYPEINLDNTQPTIVGDICSVVNPLTRKYDLIINQATLEHLYNPFQAMYNLSTSLNKDGLLVSHTHPPAFPYHRYPSDYIRFMKDWWYDLPKYINGIYLQELYMDENKYVFSCYIHY